MPTLFRKAFLTKWSSGQVETTLAAQWRSSPDFFASKSCDQLVRIAGDGRLLDGSTASTQFREFLAQVPGDNLRTYAEECLSQRFENAPYALQDIVNEIGSRLGFDVEHGRYRGVRGQVGFDGIWRSADRYALLIEVKTTDAYRMNLDTVAKYRDTLIRESRLQDAKSSVLLAVGREDTGDLEAQIRGSRHAWDIRVISIDALLRLMAVKEQMSDWGTSSQINLLLQPMEYTRVDGIVNLLFATAKDIEEPHQDEQHPGGPEELEDETKPSTDAFDHDSARKAALQRVERHLGHPLRKKGRVFWSSADESVSLVCISSKPYEETSGTGFWYGFTPGQKKFLDESQIAYVLFICGHELPPILIDCNVFAGMLSKLQTTPPTPSPDAPLRHWHVVIYSDGVRAQMHTPSKSCQTDISSYLLT